MRMETSGTSIVYTHPGITSVVECIRNKFYFATLVNDRREPRNTPEVHLFNIDDELVYNNFYNDFGPLNLACLYKYCCRVNKKLRNPGNKRKHIVHCTSGQNQEKRANAVYLFTSYAILYLKRNPKDVHASLIEAVKQPLKPFQDASMGVSIYNIRLQDCLNAIHKAATFGFFNFDDFDLAEYEKYEKMRHGDINWMIPDKFLAFAGPSTEIGTAYHPPERYIDYFTRNDVVAVVRLNRKSYDPAGFTRAGIAHYDMFMPDGSAPPRYVLNQFLQLAETTTGPIAVHCKAGLGRTGSLIAAYMIKHYRMSAREAIAWLRICRPGSVIGHQQAWLETMENELWRSGQQYRLKRHGNGDIISCHKRGIYSIAQKAERRAKINEKESGKVNDRRVGNDRRVDKAAITGPSAEPDNKWSRAKKIASKPGIASIFAGKFRAARGLCRDTMDFRSTAQVTNKRMPSACATRHEACDQNDNKTQGDRLNEIKAARNKFCRA